MSYLLSHFFRVSFLVKFNSQTRLGVSVPKLFHIISTMGPLRLGTCGRLNLRNCSACKSKVPQKTGNFPRYTKVYRLSVVSKIT